MVFSSVRFELPDLISLRDKKRVLESDAEQYFEIPSTKLFGGSGVDSLRLFELFLDLKEEPEFFQKFTENDYRALEMARAVEFNLKNMKNPLMKKEGEKYIQQKEKLYKELFASEDYQKAKPILKEVSRLNDVYANKIYRFLDNKEREERYINRLIWSFSNLDIWGEMVMHKVEKSYNKSKAKNPEIKFDEYIANIDLDINKGVCKPVVNTRRWYAAEARKILKEIQRESPDTLWSISPKDLYGMVQKQGNN